jgi:hypothetical protein
MYGLEAINAHNGWAMALAGTCIVLAGLAVLSFIISLFPKLVGAFEKEELALPVPSEEPEPTPTKIMITERPANLEEAAEIYGPLVAALGEEFKMEELHALFREQNLPHPHITIRNFWNEGLLKQTESGTFLWTAK